MGLDMYLERATDVGYWRKANQIHNWFDKLAKEKGYENGVENCARISVYKEDLLELRGLCERVLENHDLAEELLPTQSGFFYGSTEYDEWYFRDLEDTIEIIDKTIKETNWETDRILYRAWW